MINMVESLEPVISKELKPENIPFIQKIFPVPPVNISPKKIRRKSNFKEITPLCYWKMPAQPQGYIKAGKYDLL